MDPFGPIPTEALAQVSRMDCIEGSGMSYRWELEYDNDAEEHFIIGPHGTVAMVHRPEDGPLLASAPKMFDELTHLRREVTRLGGQQWKDPV